MALRIKRKMFFFPAWMHRHFRVFFLTPDLLLSSSTYCTDEIERCHPAHGDAATARRMITQTASLHCYYYIAKGRGGGRKAYPTSNGPLVNFRLSSDAEILLTSAD